MLHAYPACDNLRFWVEEIRILVNSSLLRYKYDSRQESFLSSAFSGIFSFVRSCQNFLLI